MLQSAKLYQEFELDLDFFQPLSAAYIIVKIIIIIKRGAAADSAAAAKKAKYTDIANIHIFLPVAIETGGRWNVEAIELIQEIGRRITLINGESRETEYLFQCISIAIQKGNHLAYQSTFQTEPNF